MREAVQRFYRTSRPIDHFHTSAQRRAFAPAIAGIITRLAPHINDMTVVDVGAGNGELLHHLYSLLPEDTAHLVAVEIRERPEHLPEAITWQDEPPEDTTGLLVACELLDNMPLDVAVATDQWRYQEITPNGDTRPGPPLTEADLQWIEKYWPHTDRVEIGRQRDQTWQQLVSTVSHGAAIAIDYGHTRANRPHDTIASYRDGQQIPLTVDGTADLTAHVAVDSLGGDLLLPQREALLRCGLTGVLPPHAQAHTDPMGYVHALAQASEEAELIDKSGLGKHWWVVNVRGIDLELVLPVHQTG